MRHSYLSRIYANNHFATWHENVYSRSSCCDRNRRADISAKVQPPMKNTMINFDGSELESSLVMEFPGTRIHRIFANANRVMLNGIKYKFNLRLANVDTLYETLLTVGPGSKPITSFKPCHPLGCTSCSASLTLSGAYMECT